MKELTDLEISTLRQEVLQTTNQALEFTKFSVTTTAAFVGAGLALNDAMSSYIVLMPLAILAACYLLIVARRCSIRRINTYLRAFSGSEFRWEHRLWEMRQRPDSSRFSVARTQFWIFAISGAACCCIAVLVALSREISVAMSVFCFVLWVVGCIWEWRRLPLLGGTEDERIFRAWLGIRAKEEVAAGDS